MFQNRQPQPQFIGVVYQQPQANTINRLEDRAWYIRYKIY